MPDELLPSVELTEISPVPVPILSVAVDFNELYERLGDDAWVVLGKLKDLLC